MIKMFERILISVLYKAINNNKTASTSIIHFLAVAINNWGWTREALTLLYVNKKRCRPACAPAQTDQCLCFSLPGRFHMLICYMQKVSTIASSYCSAVRVELHLVAKLIIHVFTRQGLYFESPRL